MALSSVPYPAGLAAALGEVDLTDVTIRGAILDDQYAYNPAAQFFDAINRDEVSGAGYVAGGETIGNVALSIVLADDWSQVWSGEEEYAEGELVRPTSGNGRLYRCIVAGTSAGSEPSWPTVPFDTVDDGTVRWAEAGVAVVAVAGDDVEWSEVTFEDGASLQVYVDGTAGEGDWLLGHVEFPGPVSVAGEEFRVEFDAVGLLAGAVRG